jgi:uncharacterized phage protein (TIGR01671 family)
MRDILFRAWHPKLKKMLYAPSEVDSMTLCRDAKGKHVEFVTENRPKGGSSYFPAILTWDGRYYIHGGYQEVIWMLYTGFVDNNSVQVYEGDLVKFIYFPGDYTCVDVNKLQKQREDELMGKFYTGEVYWDESYSGFQIRVPYKTSSYITFPVAYASNKMSSKGEVIGNIYEKKEKKETNL